MSAIPHPEPAGVSLNCAVITVSDTRTVETDSSGRLARESLIGAGHRVGLYLIVPDEPVQIRSLLEQLRIGGDIEVTIVNGGTGIAPRDTTYDALEPLLEKTLSGFGELFRYLSYGEIGSRALASRAIAGTYDNMLIFSVPGSTAAVRLALDKLILPEIVHLVGQLRR